MHALRPLPTTIVASLALAVPVGTESFFPRLSDVWWGHVLLLVSQTVAWVLLLLLLRDLRRSTEDGTRSRRVGAALTIGGTVLQLVFVAAYATSMVLAGEPHDLVFVPFSLGFLALTFGGVTWGTGLRRAPEHRQTGLGLWLVAGLGLAAILVPVDPWHEVVLIGSYLAWTVMGRGVAQSSSSSASARSSFAVGRAALGSGWRPAR